ncbi:ABC transporter substrate-binding protein [Streptomyces sp. NPDC005438]|uniref:ABC transporter substrate-binding protein n=1 Tax=Streptomyces sp. NPDC005438 TaxID=3156880 RepID=UPI0033AD9CE4
MSKFSSRRSRATVVALCAGALVLSGCSAGGGDSSEKSDRDSAKKLQSQIKIGTAKDSVGPAPAVEGASKGGTIKVLQRDSYSHLDPAQIYVSDEGSVATLIHRRLTDYKLGANGRSTLVGDLATDTGQKSDGGKTWTYKLKDGIKFENGDEITSDDVRHTIERTFADFINEGPIFIQQWLANKSGASYRKLLKGGPYEGKHLSDDILETPDKKTVVFKFKKPVADLPYALAMAGYGVVSKKHDTKEKYDKKPLSSGPYKITSFKTGKSMKMVRNENWDAKTDPVRHQYPDTYDFQFGVTYADSTQRLMADNGENKTAVSFNNQVDAGNMQGVRSKPDVKKRSIDGYQPYVGVLNFNLKRPNMKDKLVREAIAHAIPNRAVLQAFGGSGGGELAGNLISPTVSGYKDTDPYNKIKKPMGDVKKAKALLKKAGKTGMKITYAYMNSAEPQKYSVAIADNLKKAGFDVQRKDLPSDTFYDLVGKVDNKYDIYHSAWGADWPSASTVVPPTLDGRTIQNGASNYAHYNNPKMNKEMDRISQIADPKKAADEWFKLADKILREDLPQVPIFYYKQIQLHGSKVGGVVNSDILHGIDPTRLYVKK